MSSAVFSYQEQCIVADQTTQRYTSVVCWQTLWSHKTSATVFRDWYNFEKCNNSHACCL